MLKTPWWTVQWSSCSCFGFRLWHTVTKAGDKEYFNHHLHCPSLNPFLKQDTLYICCVFCCVASPVFCSTWQKPWSGPACFCTALCHNASGRCHPAVATHNIDNRHKFTEHKIWELCYSQTYIQILQTVPAEGVFAAFTQHLSTALVPLYVNTAHRTLFDGHVWLAVVSDPVVENTAAG